MNLVEAMGLSRREVVAFVGAGGKTTAMFRLAHELEERGWRVLSTTTTAIFAPSEEESRCVLLVRNLEEAVAALPGLLGEHGHVTLGSAYHDLPGRRKLLGLEPAAVCALAKAELADALLVEADGSARKPIKAPAAHEPVIPPCSTLVAALVGADAFGQPLSEEVAHRPELVARVVGLELGQPLTPSAVARLLTSEDGALKGVPPSARYLPIINKVEGSARRAAALEVVRLLAGYPRCDRVLLTSLLPCCQVEMMGV